jgi:hypothetical protein
MVDSSVNGTQVLEPELELELPELIHLTTADSSRVPSPGTMRALKAETGRSWDELMGEKADPADRFQTIIWARLRKTMPGLRWDDCADVELQIDDAAAAIVDPTKRSDSETSQVSAGSGA